jgi:hypothetical protein
MTARTNNGKNKDELIDKGDRLEAAEVEVVFEEEEEPEDGGGEEEGVDAVEDAAVAGEHGAGVFDACAAFDGGFEEIA